MGRYDSFKNIEREIVKDVVRDAVRDEIVSHVVKGEVTRNRVVEDVDRRVRRELEDRAIDSIIRKRR